MRETAKNIQNSDIDKRIGFIVCWCTTETYKRTQIQRDRNGFVYRQRQLCVDIIYIKSSKSTIHKWRSSIDRRWS